MRKVILFLLTIISLCGCSSFKLVNTVWVNARDAELDGEKGIVFTTLYFGEDNVVNFNTSVMQDTTLIVPPCFTEYGEYTYSGTLKKGIKLNIKTIDLDNRTIQYKGIICKYGMVLVSQDSIAKGYKFVKNARLK